jgi:hypothetical protein
MTPNATFFYAPHGAGMPRPPSNTCGHGSGSPRKLSRGRMTLRLATIWGMPAFRYCSPYAFTPECASSERIFAVLTLGVV